MNKNTSLERVFSKWERMAKNYCNFSSYFFFQISNKKKLWQTFFEAWVPRVRRSIWSGMTLPWTWRLPSLTFGTMRISSTSTSAVTMERSWGRTNSSCPHVRQFSEASSLPPVSQRWAWLQKPISKSWKITRDLLEICSRFARDFSFRKTQLRLLGCILF